MSRFREISLYSLTLQFINTNNYYDYEYMAGGTMYACCIIQMKALRENPIWWSISLKKSPAIWKIVFPDLFP